MKKSRLFIRANRGFTLVEAVIVLGFLAGLGVFLGNFIFQGVKGQKRVSASFGFTTKMWEVFNLLQNSSYCGASKNLVFKEKNAAGSLVRARLSSENNPTINTVN